MDRAELAGKVLSTSLVRWLLRGGEDAASWPENRLVVLTYHRVDDELSDGRVPGLVSASPSEFAEHAAVLAERYDVVDIDTVLAALAGTGRLPERSVLLTFDDAVDDFERHALPVLQDTGLPAALFVPTAMAGEPDAAFWWDAVHAAVTTTSRREPIPSPLGPLPMATAEDRTDTFRRLRAHVKSIPYADVRRVVDDVCEVCEVNPPPARVMGWDALRRLARSGVACCAHTRTHPHLDQIPLDEARTEIEGSLDDLRRELGSTPPVFAYPSGRWTPEVADLVRRAGVRAAFTTRRGSNTLGASDPLTLRRINVSRRTGFGAARAQMLPWADRPLAALGRAS